MNPLAQFEKLALILAGVVALAGLMAWRSSAKCGKSLRLAILGARILAMAALAAIAVNPGSWRQESELRESYWAVMADRSMSMATRDAAGRSRWEEACRLCGRIAALAGNPARLRVYAFAGKLEPVESGKALPALKPDGGETDILGSGRMALQLRQAGGRRLAGIFLLSDGRQTRSETDPTLGVTAMSQEAPIYALPLGGAVARRNLSIAAGLRQCVGFSGRQMKVAARLKNEGLGNLDVEVELLDSAGRKVADQRAALPDNGEADVQLALTPESAGYREYVLRVPRFEGESRVEDNEARAPVFVLDQKVRILMVEGQPHWDSKFLAQLLRKQPHMTVNSIYRVSSDRFLSVGTDTATAKEDTAPVFPDSKEELSACDMVIFGKGAEYFLTPARVQLLKSFVRDQGGTLVFARSKPYSGSFEELAALEPAAWGVRVEGKFRFRPTEAGESFALFGGILPLRGHDIWDKLPPLQHAYRCEAPQMFTEVLAEGALDDAAPGAAIPLILCRRYGKGIVVCMNVEGLWQWDFFPTVREAGNMYQELWVQLIQWAGTYSEFLPGHDLSLRLTESAVLPGVPVRAVVVRRGSGGQGSAPTLRVSRGSDLVQELSAAQVAGEGGRWDAVLQIDEPGQYRVEVSSAESKAAPSVGLLVRTPPSEQDDLSADAGFLKLLAESSGGKVVTESELEDIIRRAAPEREVAGAAKAVWVPAWNRWWLLALILFFLAAECFMRRRSGLL